MKQTITFDDFKHAFKNRERENHFSNDGLITLFDYLEDLEKCFNKEYELDVIDLCSKLQEMDELEFIKQYGMSIGEGMEHFIMLPIEGTNRYLILIG